MISKEGTWGSIGQIYSQINLSGWGLAVDDNYNLGLFYNGLMVFMLDGDDAGGHCMVSINM